MPIPDATILSPLPLEEGTSPIRSPDFPSPNRGSCDQTWQGPTFAPLPRWSRWQPLTCAGSKVGIQTRSLRGCEVGRVEGRPVIVALDAAAVLKRGQVPVRGPRGPAAGTKLALGAGVAAAEAPAQDALRSKGVSCSGSPFRKKGPIYSKGHAQPGACWGVHGN